MERGKVVSFMCRAVAIVVGAIFLWAGGLKVLDPNAFATDIDNYRLVSREAGTLIAIFLPWLECTCGLSLILNRFYHGGALLGVVLSGIFVFALSAAVLRGLDISCGCFGQESNSASEALVRAGGIFLAASLLYCVACYRPAQRSRHLWPPEPR